MSDPRPEEIIRAEELFCNGKVEEASKIVMNFEKRSDITPEEQLWTLIFRGWQELYSNLQFQKGVEIGEQVFMKSQELGFASATIDALMLKAYIIALGEFDEGLEYLLEAENLIKNLADTSTLYLSRQKVGLLIIKSLGYYFKGDYNKALENGLKALEIGVRISYKVLLILIFQVLGYIYAAKGQPNVALEYATKGLETSKEIDHQNLKGSLLALMGLIYYYKGDLNLALKSCRQYLSLNNPINRNDANVLFTLGNIYRERGELEQSLQKFKKAFHISEELSLKDQKSLLVVQIGSTYRTKGDYDHAIEHLEKSLALSEEIGYTIVLFWSLLWLIFINLENKSMEQAEQYKTRLKQVADKTDSKWFAQGCLLADSMVLLAKGRSRNRGEAEVILKQIAEDKVLDPQFHIIAIVALCDYLLEELYEYNDSEILDELNPLIRRLLTIAKNQNSISYLAEGKLLQAKLALIQMDLEGAKSMLTQVQQIAEDQGLNFLAQKISSEHDILLEKIDDWDKLKDINAPMAERIELASFDGVIKRLQGKRAVEPPELKSEESVVLLIMAAGGVPVFSYPFTDEWKRDNELFGSFLSAFTSFSDEFFSEGFDRAKFGQYTVLLKSVADFSVCYLFKGQTYPASQKITRFSEDIQTDTSIWQSLNQHYQVSQVLELNELPPLKNLLTKIFLTKTSEIDL